jgi:hypothetical protein
VLLAAAWLHDIGYALEGDAHAVAGARALRRAGHERLARIVAHHSNAAERARWAGMPPIDPEFPRPSGDDAELLSLLDIADLLTGPGGERVDPAGRLADMVERRGAASPSCPSITTPPHRSSHAVSVYHSSLPPTSIPAVTRVHPFGTHCRGVPATLFAT